MRTSSPRLLILLSACLVIAGCRGTPWKPGGGAGGRAHDADLPTQRIEERVQVTLPDGFVVRAELADEKPEIRTGLMGRAEVPEGTGMLFVFPDAGHRSFWMKNCLVSLDIIWLAQTPEGGRVVHVAPRLPPCREDPCPSWTPMRAGRYVLELGAGEAARHGLAIGSLVTFRLPSSMGSP